MCQPNRPIAYSRAREELLWYLDKCGYDAKLYGLHSFRSGGATAAASRGVNDRLFKRHGRWRSETAKDGYVQDELESLLTVSRNLGL